MENAPIGSPLNHAATARKHSTGSPFYGYNDPLQKVVRTSGGSDHSVEQSPLHRNHVKSALEKKVSGEGAHGVAPNTPGRFKTKTGGGRGDESPEKGTVVPKFGEWDESDPATADGYTDVFNQVRDERQSGSAKVPQITDDSIYLHSYGQPRRSKSSDPTLGIKAWLSAMATTSNASQYHEGQSTQRQPLFDGTNYNYWKCRMKIYLQSINYEIWNTTKAEYTAPTIPYAQWNDEMNGNTMNNAKAMNALFCALTKEEFNRVSNATTAYQIWHTLEVTHEGTNKVKESKISVLVHRFEMFRMKENENVSDMITRFTNITNSLVALGKTYTQAQMVMKVLRALTPEWEKKTAAIREANDLTQLSLENLVGNLMAY